MSKESYMEAAVKWVQKKVVTEIRADYDGFEAPKAFVNRTTNTSVEPDVTFKTSNGGKHYTEIALKSEDAQDLVTKWKFLSTLASMKNGKLHLLAPKGHKMFTNKLVNEYNIDAQVHSI